MNDTLIMPSLNGSGLYGQPLDCSHVQLQMCSGLTSGVDSAIAIMAIGIIMIMLRKPFDWIGERWQPFCIISNYLDSSALPELLLIVGVIFIGYVRWMT